MYKCIIIAVALVASGCSSNEESFGSGIPKKTTVSVTSSTAYPYLLDVPHPTKLVLEPVIMDYPRDKTKPKQIKTDKSCLEVPYKGKSFEADCMEYPIDLNSNIFIGMSENDWKKFLINQARLLATVEQYKNRIDEINKEREEWRKLSSNKK